MASPRLKSAFLFLECLQPSICNAEDDLFGWSEVADLVVLRERIAGQITLCRRKYMNKERIKDYGRIVPVSRRRFVQGIAAGAAVSALGWRGLQAFAETTPYMPSTLTGKQFELTIDSLAVNFTGRRSQATAINGSVPGPTLKWREGDTVAVAVTNRLKVPTSIHWHGVRLPADMDGVPGLSYPGIAPGETFVYRIPVVQSGTYWYHSHSRFQEQTGLAGALIIERQGRDMIEFDREYTVLLADWTDTNPETVFSNLKEQSDYYNYHRLTLPNFVSEAKSKGLGATLSDRLAWARMNMSPTDLSDVSGATYTYLMNGNAPNTNWTGLFQPRERVRLRFINGSSMTFFDVRIPGLKMTVVQADGNDVEPVVVDEFRIGVAEIYDVIVQPQDNSAYTVFAQAEDRTGFARGTLAPKAGMTAPVPPMDPRPMRTMADMGMGNMKGMNMAGKDGMKQDDTTAIAHQDNQDMAGMDMSPTSARQHLPAASEPQPMTTMVMGNSAGTSPFLSPDQTPCRSCLRLPRARWTLSWNHRTRSRCIWGRK